MIIRIVIVFLPSIVGLLWQNDAMISIFWSLAGSFFIAGLALTAWFRQDDDAPISQRLLRPCFMYQFFFIVYHVIGAGFSSLDVSGHRFWGTTADSSQYELSLNATAQALMLAAHASVTAGMKLVNFRYQRHQYIIAFVPPYRLLLVSLSCLLLGNVLSVFPSLFNFSDKFIQISSTAVLVEILLAIWRRNHKNLASAMSLLAINILWQMQSGWRGPLLWTMITLEGLLYPLMARRVVVGGIAFAFVWALYVHPFTLTLRPLLWYQGLDCEIAVSYSIDQAINMPFSERLDKLWELLAGRVNDLYQFRRYIEYVPNVRPYYGLGLVLQAQVALVPRIIWPDKPDLERASMQLVYDAGVVSEQSIVSAKSNFYQDAYLSGSWAFVVVASLVLGMAIVLIGHTCERLFGGYEIGTCLIFTSLFTQTLVAPQNFTFFVGSLCSGLVVMFAAFYFGRATGWILSAQPLGQPTLSETSAFGHPSI